MATGTEFGVNPEAYEKFRPTFVKGVGRQAVVHCLEKSGFKRGDTVLEIGSGTGNSTFEFLRHGIHVVSVEPDARMIAYAKRRRGEHIVDSFTNFIGARQLASRSPRSFGKNYVVNNTFAEAVTDGTLPAISGTVEGFAGAIAFTSLHWPMRQDGRFPTVGRLASLLPQGARVGTASLPQEVIATQWTDTDTPTSLLPAEVQQQRRFLRMVREHWPTGYRNNADPAQLVRRVEELYCDDLTPYFKASEGNLLRAAEAEVLSAEQVIGRMSTYCENLELDAGVRERFYAEVREGIATTFGGRVIVGSGATAQVVERI